MVNLIEFGGDANVFIDKCYGAYINFWDIPPTFNGKSISRNRNIVRGKESSFWEVAEGHSGGDMDPNRYGKIPLMAYLIQNVRIDSPLENDVIFFKKLHKRKVRVEIFSRSQSYILVLQENARGAKYQLITAFPLTERQLSNKDRHCIDFWNRGGIL